MKKKSSIAVPLVLDRAQFSKLTGLSTGTISSKRDIGIIVCARGSARQGAKMQIKVTQSLRNLFAERVTHRGADHDRITAARAEKFETMNRLAKRELIEASEVQQSILQAISFLAQALDAIPQRVTGDEQLQAKIEDELKNARNRFSDDLKSLAEGPKAP